MIFSYETSLDESKIKHMPYFKRISSINMKNIHFSILLYRSEDKHTSCIPVSYQKLMKLEEYDFDLFDVYIFLFDV